MIGMQMTRDGAWLSTEELRSVFEQRQRRERPKKATLEALAVDLAMVSEGVRSGYLFDSVSLTSDEALELSRRAMAFGRATAFLHVKGSTDDHTQWFFINLAILSDRLCNQDYPVWVQLEDSAIRVIADPPTGLALVLQDLSIQLQTPCTFLDMKTQAGAEVLCPFAAFLIEYPYAYIPSAGGSSDFGGSLVAVELTLFSDLSELSLMKFSYPASLDGPKATDDIQRLISTLLTRLPGTRWSSIASSSHIVPATGVVL